MHTARNKVFVATARPIRLVYDGLGVLRGLSFLERRGVFYNGALALDETVEYYRHYPIPSTLVDSVIGSIETHDAYIQVAIQNQEEYHSFRRGDDPSIDSWGFPAEERIEFSEARRRECSKIVAWDEAKDLSEMFRELHALYRGRLNLHHTDSGRWIQITAKEATKENALMELLQHNGISADEVVIFGDDLPDRGMFNKFGCSIAMANAVDPLKDIATYVTLSNDEDGVAYAIKNLLDLLK